MIRDNGALLREGMKLLNLLDGAGIEVTRAMWRKRKGDMWSDESGGEPDRLYIEIDAIRTLPSNECYRKLGDLYTGEKVWVELTLEDISFAVPSSPGLDDLGSWVRWEHDGESTRYVRGVIGL